MAEPFQVRIAVRGYEIDAQGHLNGVVYLQYGEHARWECLRAAGISQNKLFAAGVGPVQLETTIRFHRELRAGDEVDVSCVFVWGDGKDVPGRAGLPPRRRCPRRRVGQCRRPAQPGGATAGARRRWALPLARHGSPVARLVTVSLR